MGMDSVYKLSVVMGLTDELTTPLTNVQSNVTNVTSSLNNAFGTLQKSGAILTGLGTAITGACLGTVKSTFETQNALGELASLGVTDLQAVESAAKSFSDTWAGTTKSDFITASYDIKSGIASLSDEGVAKFTELAALTGKATKSTTEEMGSLFATGYGIYKGYYEDLSDIEFGEMFSAGIATAVKNYKTSGSQMAASISMLGATATNNNVPLEEQLAILGQLQTTMSGSEAATKYKSFLNQAAKAGKTLGLTFTDANNQLLSTPEILSALRTKYGDTIDAVEKQQLKEAFGTDEAVAMIDLLYNNVDQLTTGVDDLASSMKKGTGVTQEMANAINNTPEQKFKVLKQQIHNNVEELGKNLLPTVNETMDSVSGVISKGSEWINYNQALISTIMNVGLKLGIVLLVIGSIIGVIGTVGKAIISVRAALTTLKAGWTALSVAFSTTPVGWVVLAIAGLVAAFAILWNKSEAFRNFWIGLFDQVRVAVLNTWNSIKPAFSTLGENLIGLYNASKPILKIVVAIAEALITLAIGRIVGYIQGIIAALTPLTNALSSLVSFATNVISAIVALFKGDFSGAIDYAKNAIDDLKNFFINGIDAILSFAEGFADGFLSTIGGALNAVGIDVSEKITAMKETIHNGLDAIKDFYGNIMSAAAETAKSKLDNIKSAYQSHGGGIKGITAAALEGVKGYYTAGLTFVDNLTNGKLTAIRDKFKGKLSEVKSNTISALDSIKASFGDKLESAYTKVTGALKKIQGAFNFKWKLPNLKVPDISVSGGKAPYGIAGKGSLPKFDVKWHAEGGVMTKPTIFGAFGNKLLGGGEAGDEAILPLAKLWDKLHKFIQAEVGNNKSTGNSAVESVASALSKKEVRTLEKSEKETSNDSLKEYRTNSKSTGIAIQTLNITVDLKKIKDIHLLEQLINEIKDSQNSTDDPEVATT